MKTIKISDETYAKLKGISKAYNEYMKDYDYKDTVSDTIDRLTQYEWENPAYDGNGVEESIKCNGIANEEYRRIMQK